MDKIGVYVNGQVNVPERFWEYALVTDLNEQGEHTLTVKEHFTYDQKNTDLYNSLTEEEKKKINFVYINGKRITKI